MLAGRKYRLKLTEAQADVCEEFANVCRAVWNTALDQRCQAVARWRRGFDRPFCGYHLQARELAEAKAEDPWLKAAPSHVLQQALQDLDRACRERGTVNVKFRAKHRWNPSFRFPDGPRIAVEKLNRAWGRAKLPKLRWVTFRMTRPIGGTIRSATVSRKGGHWYVSFLVEDGQLTPQHHPGTPVGLDRGVATAATTSDGTVHDREFATGGEKARYRRLQQRLARHKKGSANRAKTLKAMGRIATRAVDRRSDFCAWTANRLTARHSVVVLEDLRTTNMTASARGTAHSPGERVAQKSGLNRAILDKGWHRMELAIRNAARSIGTRVVLVDPAYTSQRCSACGFVTNGNRESQAIFVCKANGCGHAENADVNAAKNILNAAGLAVSACGDLATWQSAKQEPAGTREEVPPQPAPLVGIPRL